MTPATIHAPERKMPALAFFAAMSLLVSPVAITTANAHGGDTDLVHACVGRDKIVRAVAPSKRCKRSEKAVHWEIAEPNSLSGLTVVDATGRPVGQTVEVEAEEVTVLLTVGGREVELEVSPEGFTEVEDISGFADTRDLHLGELTRFYPDSLDCSGTPHIRKKDSVRANFVPTAYVDLQDQNVFLVDPQTPPRVLSVGAAYSVLPEGNDCLQRTIEPGDEELAFFPVQLLGDLNTFGFVTPFRLQ